MGRVTTVTKTRVKVEYVIGTERCDKTLLRTSADLMPAPQATGGVAAVGPPVRAAPGGYAQAPATASAASPRRAAEVPYPDNAQRRWVESSALPAAHQPPVAADVPVLLGQQPQAPTTPRRRNTWKIEGLPEGQLIKLVDLTFGEILGSGGFGTVYSGTLRGHEVAIKKLHIPDAFQIAQEQMRDFSKEVSNLQGMRHDRLIRYIGVTFEPQMQPPVICIITELAARGSLYHLLYKGDVNLDQAKRRELVLQIVEGVDFLHSRKPTRVHRDLKSANVVLDRELNAKLCDFGLTESMEKTHISRRDQEGGSPRYMAPEVFDPRQKLTEKIDIWALGCLVAEIFTNKLPHEDCSSIQQVAAKLIVKRLAPYPDDSANALHPEVWKTVNRCFAFAPPDRPSAEGIHRDLSALEQPLVRSRTVPQGAAHSTPSLGRAISA